MKHLNSKLNGYIYSVNHSINKKNGVKLEDKIKDHVFKIGKVSHSSPVDETNMEIEPVYCKTFGCGKKLSLIETLLGNKCVEHSQIKQTQYHNPRL